MSTKDKELCEFCYSKTPTTHTVIVFTKAKCPANGANVRLYRLCSSCVVDEQEILCNKHFWLLWNKHLWSEYIILSDVGGTSHKLVSRSRKDSILKEGK